MEKLLVVTKKTTNPVTRQQYVLQAFNYVAELKKKHEVGIPVPDVIHNHGCLVLDRNLTTLDIMNLYALKVKPAGSKAYWLAYRYLVQRLDYL